MGVLESAPTWPFPKNAMEKVMKADPTWAENVISGKSIIGVKHDEDKLDWSLLPIEPIEETIRVLMIGAEKYAPDNWKYVEDSKRRYYNAAMRHLTAYQKGESLDEETGKSHLAHATCCLLFMLHNELENGE